VTVSESVQYTIGTGVRCEEGECGSIERVVIDPVAQRVTHLVVDPGRGEDKLVPVTLVDDEAEGIKLACTAGEFAALESAEEGQFLPGGDNDFGYDPAQTMVWPFFRPNIALAGGMNPPPFHGPSSGGGRRVQERVPAGEVQIRRGDRVEARDGEAGRVRGLVVDGRQNTVSHVLLSEGHLWGRKTVAVPIADVDNVGPAIRVSYTKEELKDLPDLQVT
jgi:sporulation protein YlmC with PRC-barrel domain